MSDSPKPVNPQPTAAKRMTFSGKPESYKWLLPGFIPCNCVTLVTGEKACGKSTLLSAVSAHVMGGPPLPQSFGRRTPANVCWLTREESYTLDLIPRLKACGLKAISRLRIPSDPTDPTSSAAWVFPRDLPLLSEWIKTNKVKLLILDPLSSFVDPPDTIYQPTLCRPLLESLAKLARSLQCTILPIVHLNKDEGANLLNRTSGATDLANVCRSVTRILIDPADRKFRFLVSVACNIASPPKPWKFRIIDSSVSRTIHWEGEVETTAETLAERAGDTIDRTLVRECAEWLKALLTNPDARDVTVQLTATSIKKEAEKNGFSIRTLWRAKHILGVESKQVYDHTNGVHFRVWQKPAQWPAV